MVRACYAFADNLAQRALAGRYRGRANVICKSGRYDHGAYRMAWAALERKGSHRIMWLVAKDTAGTHERVAVSDTLRAALVRWYSGTGSEADHRASVALVTAARDNHKWIACDCLGPMQPPPMMSPAYLSFQETYYLRRLTARPAHAAECPFHMPQAPQRLRETAEDALHAIEVPHGLFNAHRKAPEKLAQKPDATEPDDRSRGVAIPRLGRLLWLLLERAGANVLAERPGGGAEPASIGTSIKRLRQAARGLDIAPGIALSRHLYTTAIEYEVRRVHARLREAAADWPEPYAPQAFLLLEAGEITGREIVTGLGTVTIRNRIQHSGILRAEVEPPFLVLAVVGEHSKREGYGALRAYAQPVFTGNRFIPCEREDDRFVLRALIAAQAQLRERGLRMAAKKVLFDLPTDLGPARPDFLVSILDEESGEEISFALQMIRSQDSEHLELRAIERARLARLGPVLQLDLGTLDARRIAEAVLQMVR